MLGVLVALKVSVLGWLVWRVLPRGHYDRARIFLILGCWTAAVGASFARRQRRAEDAEHRHRDDQRCEKLACVHIRREMLPQQMNRSR